MPTRDELRAAIARAQALIERLERSLSREPAGPSRHAADGPYARSLALAGNINTSFRNVSSNKYRHVAEAAAARRRGR